MRKTEVTITYLEMRKPPHVSRPELPAGVRVRELEVVHPDKYRDLYNGVGRNWHWTDRAGLSDAEIQRLVGRPDVSVFVLDVDGEEAGFAELEVHKDGSAQIAYFGLLPDYIGRSLARPFLQRIIEEAWKRGRRVWLHTCSLDHPAALPLYRSSGFSPFRTARKLQDLRADADNGTMPPPGP